MNRYIFAGLVLSYAWCCKDGASQISGGGGAGTVDCAGTPGNTNLAKGQMCKTTAGAVYICNNPAGCTTSGDVVLVSLGGTAAVTVVGGGSLTSTAFATGGGTTTVQTPSATSTLDASGNASFAGFVGGSSFVGGTSFAVLGGEQAKPSAPGSGAEKCWFDSTDHTLECEDSGGTVLGKLGNISPNTVTAGSTLTNTALVTGGGTKTVQTPAATAVMDSSGNISTPGTMSAAGFIGSTEFSFAGAEQAAPTFTTSGAQKCYFDSTAHVLNCKDSTNAVVQTGVKPATCTNQFVSALASTGALTCATVALAAIATQAADTVLMNNTASGAVPAAVAMPTSGTDGCAGASDALTYNTSTHALGCHQAADLSSVQTLTNKTLTAPSMTPQSIDCHTACSPTAAQLSNAMVWNYGQGASNVAITGPTVAAGMNFIMIVGTAQASNSWTYTSTTANIYLDASTTAVTNIIFAAPAVGDSFSCFSFQTGASTYALKCTTLAGTATSS